MNSASSIKESILYLRNFQRITRTYQEIAATRMQRVKNSVLHNREYLEETRGIFHEVITSYKDYVMQLLKEKDLKPNKKDKKVTILLSANTKLYGAIINQIFNKFFEYVQNTDTEIIISGKSGLEMYKENGGSKPYQFFDIPDDIISLDALSDIISTITSYSEIVVFHGQFEDILTQVVKKTAITPDTAYNEKMDSTESDTQYIFEPTIEEVLDYFEKEILGSLFVQTVNESNLSKFTARMIALSSTSENTEKQIQSITQKMKILEHRIINKKQQEQLSSLMLWNI